MTHERHLRWHPILLWYMGHCFCVYLGHEKLGYLHCDSGQKFQVPADDLCLNSSPYPPTYIVPIPTSTDLKENRTILTVVCFEDRVSFLQKRYSPRLMYWLKDVSKRVVSPLQVCTGSTVIFQLESTGGLALLEDELTKAFKTAVVVSVNETKGEIVIFCPDRLHEMAKIVVCRVIESLQACVESFPTKLSYPDEESDTSSKILLGAGALIHETDTHDGVENMAMLYVRNYKEKRKEKDEILTEDYVMARLTQVVLHIIFFFCLN